MPLLSDDIEPSVFIMAAELQSRMQEVAKREHTANTPKTLASEPLAETLPPSVLAKHALAESLRRAWQRSRVPLVSIIIPVFNKAAYTMQCLESLSRQVSKHQFEVIVVDNDSSDETADLVGGVAGIRYIRNSQNEGFVEGCNIGARQARGDIIVLLNNDTNVLGGWLDGLVDRLLSDSTIGLVGSKLIYPDGSLQEAGGILFSDASGHNFGKHCNSNLFQYNYVRDVDYCSGASIAFYRKDFQKLGGFDKRFAPAYYEDADLALSLRHKLKKRVVYEPHSVVMHVEGGTAGTDTASGFKQYQAINQKKFLDKWRRVLATQHYPAGTDPELACRHGKQKRLLIVDGIVPEYNRDSGSLRMTEILKAAKQLGYAVTFFADNRVATMPYTAELQALGIEVVYGGVSSKDFYYERQSMYDVILLSRPLNAIWHLNYCRAYQPKAKLIYDTVDLHYLRTERQAAIEKSQVLKEEANLWKTLEYYLMDHTDKTLVVSYDEQKLLKKSKPDVQVSVVSNINPAPKSKTRSTGFDDRSGLVFIGSYAHLPNRDAASWFVGKILPLIKKRLPTIRLELLGSNPTPEVQALASNHVNVPGFIDDVLPMFDSARVFVCPLRYGAGVKGKLSQALANGVPIVSTSIGIEGMHLKDGYDCLVADNPAAFAAKTVQLYNDKILWERIRKNAIKTYRENFSEEAGRSALKEILGNS